MSTSSNTQKFILKLFPEIMVKGSSAKRDMIGQLYNNLNTLLLKIDPEIKIKKFSDKIELITPKKVLDNVRDILKNTPGIEQILEAIQFDNVDDINQIKEITNEVMKDFVENKSFVVRVKRTGQHEFTSNDIERSVGGYILAHSNANKVDLHNPDFKIQLELINRQLNIITTKYNGLSGFPIGSGGSVLSLMSGGFDSTVASYMSMKRGLKTHFIFFNLGGAAHEIGVKQVALFLWSKFGASHNVKFVTVSFEDVLEEIFNSTAPTYMGVTLKRLMIQAAQNIADKMEIDALVTGESVAQVSSQTLRNLALIDQVSTKLILRPLATVNKPEIIDIATQIGTRRFAENMPEYCGVISKNPITHGSFKRMEKEAKKFNYEVLNSAVENATTIDVHNIIDDITNSEHIEVVTDISSNKYTIIDIRGEESTIDVACETLNIPFYKLKTEFKKLPQNKKYLLYCEKGIMSQLHAQYLRDSNEAQNIKVYRP